MQLAKRGFDEVPDSAADVSIFFSVYKKIVDQVQKYFIRPDDPHLAVRFDPPALPLSCPATASLNRVLPRLYAVSSPTLPANKPTPL